MVAEESRKLASRTQSSAKEVTAKPERLKNNVKALSEYVRQVSSVSREQAAGSQEITSGIRDLAPMAGDLMAISRNGPVDPHGRSFPRRRGPISGTPYI